MLLKGKTAIVTGSNRGIGKAILIKFAENGSDVFAHARKKTDDFTNECCEISRRYGVKVIPFYFDAAKSEEIKNAVKSISDITKDIDILVNNIGAMISSRLFQMTKMQEIKEEFEVNFFSQIEFTQYISKFMLRRKKGSIINISSVSGIHANRGVLQYVSSKAALMAATKRLAIELGTAGIRVNSVAPGLADTDMGNRIDEELEREILGRLVFKRKAKPEEIADAVLFLASDMSAFITGQILRVDGGMLN